MEALLRTRVRQGACMYVCGPSGEGVQAGACLAHMEGSNGGPCALAHMHQVSHNILGLREEERGREEKN